MILKYFSRPGKLRRTLKNHTEEKALSRYALINAWIKNIRTINFLIKFSYNEAKTYFKKN